MVFEVILGVAIIIITFAVFFYRWWENNKGVQATLYVRVIVDDGREEKIFHGEEYSFYKPMLRFPSLPRVGDTVQFGDSDEYLPAEYIVAAVRLIDKVIVAQISCEEWTISSEEIPAILETMKIEGWFKQGHYDPNKTPKDYLNEVRGETL